MGIWQRERTNVRGPGVGSYLCFGINLGFAPYPPLTCYRYEAMSLRAAMDVVQDFVWCPSGCGSGQMHETGRDQPIVTCVECKYKFCFTHGVPWHETLSCLEYDTLQQDPVNFRSRFQGGAAREDRQPEDWWLQEQEESDRLFAQVSCKLPLERVKHTTHQIFTQSLHESEQEEYYGRWQEADRAQLEEEAERARREEIERVRAEVEAAQARIHEVERIRREREVERVQRDRQIERARRRQEAERVRLELEAEQTRRQREAENARIDKMRELAAEKKRQEESSLATIKQIARRCPGCLWPIQKRSGCDHLTCQCSRPPSSLCTGQ